MSSINYFQNLLEDQSLSESELGLLSKHRQEIQDCLESEFGTLPVIRYGGSKAKETMIRESYDLDIVYYFPEDDDRTLKEIYQETLDVLDQSYSVTSKTSAIRVVSLQGKNDDYHIDIVPGKFTDEDKKDAYLYISTAEGERIKTNIETHINTIKNSGCQDIIKIAKFWSTRNCLPFRTFVLELVVLESLDNFEGKDDFEESMIRFLSFLKNELEHCTLIDPANSNNIVSDLITDQEKRLISSKASYCLEILGDGEIEDETWSVVFNEAKNNESSAGITPCRDNGEEYLEDFGISCVPGDYFLKIDCIVKEDGFREFWLLKKINPLKKTARLKFKIIDDNLPVDAQIKWKVKNFGAEAAGANDLRGEITNDKGRREKDETAKYKDEHYVECYAVVGNTCIAKDKIIVPIASF